MKKSHTCLILLILFLILALCQGLSNAQSDAITITSWNIQIFGKTKSSNIDIMNDIATIISKSTLVAVEEIRQKPISENTDIPECMSKLEELIDALGVDYSISVSPRLGRSKSKEQYGFIYNSSILELVAVKVIEDPDDVFQREPYVGKFIIPGSDFDFTVGVIHTDPNDARIEIHALFSTVLSQIKEDPLLNCNNIILLGDYNADCQFYNENHFPTLVSRYDMISVIGNDVDTTVSGSTCTYDRIVISKPLLNRVMSHGVYTYNITRKMSDHYPVYVKLNCDRLVE